MAGSVCDEKPDLDGEISHVEAKEEYKDTPAVIEKVLQSTGVPDPWGKGHIRLYLACGLVYLCSTMNGFDGSLMGSINSIPEYQQYYNLPTEGSASTGLVFSIFQIAQMVAALFTWVCDWRGRKLTIIIGCGGVCASTVLTALAPTLSAFIGGRFLLSFFATIATVASPLLLVEIAPPLSRGTVAGVYNTLYYVGSIIATFTIYGCNLHIPGDLKWRLPLWLQMVCPGIVCLLGFTLPESPRWLVAKGRVQEAHAFLVKYHANGDATHPIVEIELREIKESLEGSGVRPRDFFNYRTLFNSRSKLYRLMLCVSMAWFSQFSGNNIASYYLPLMANNVGIVEVNMVLLLNGIYAVTGWIAATIGARCHDIWGRRKMLMASCAGMSVCLAVVAGTAAAYEKSGSVPASSASIAFIFIFGVVFAFSFTPMQPIYPAEVLSNDMRAKGMVTWQLSAGCAGFVNTFAAPIALSHIKYWFYVFFVFWDLFEMAFIYLFFVETKGRTLEELDEVFEAKNPRKASTMTREAREISD